MVNPIRRGIGADQNRFFTQPSKSRQPVSLSAPKRESHVPGAMDVSTRWWNHHVANTRKYADGVFDKDAAKQAAAVIHLQNGWNEWGPIAGGDIARALMGEHTVYAKRLVDSLSRGMKSGEGDIIVGYLVDNANAQTAFYASMFQGFPADDWRRYFVEHIQATGAYIIQMFTGDPARSALDFERVLVNRDHMAMLTAIAFLGFTPPAVPEYTLHRGVCPRTQTYARPKPDFIPVAPYWADFGRLGGARECLRGGPFWTVIAAEQFARANGATNPPVDSWLAVVDATGKTAKIICGECH